MISCVATTFDRATQCDDMSAGRFWRPGQPSGPPAEKRNVETSTIASPSKEDESTSIYSRKQELLYLLETHLTVIVVDDSDIDRTVLLPHILEEASWSVHGRAIAVVLKSAQAVRVAIDRIASLNSLQPEDIGGDAVGYVLGREIRRSSDTSVVYLTVDALVSEIRNDPLLATYSVVIVDEGHETSLETEILLSVLRAIQRSRGNMRVLITGISPDIENISNFYNQETTAVFRAHSLSYPVEIWHSNKSVGSNVEDVIETIKACHRRWLIAGCQPYNDMLVFMPGADGCNLICDYVSEWAASSELTSSQVKWPHKHDLDGSAEGQCQNRFRARNGSGVSTAPGSVYAVALHASMSAEERWFALQMAPIGKQRVVVATSIAEASVIVRGVSVVVDTGLQRLKLFLPNLQTNVLATVPISKAAASRRATCAGRDAPGKCFRLYSETFYHSELPAALAPELLRSDLSKGILLILSMGVPSLQSFEFLVPPTRDMLATALERLYAYRALSIDGTLTQLGERLCGISLPAPVAKSLLAGEERGVARQVASVCAMLHAGQTCFTGSKKMKEPFAVAEGDLITLLNVYRRYVSSKQSVQWCEQHGVNATVMQRAFKLCKGLVKHLQSGRVSSDALAEDADLGIAARVSRAMAVGFYHSLAVAQPDGVMYRIIASNTLVKIHPDSVLIGRTPKWIVAAEIVRGQSAYLKNVTVVDPRWLGKDVPSMFHAR